MKFLGHLSVFCLVVSQQAVNAQLQPASVSCNAAYSDPCARTNSQYLAITTAAALEEQYQREGVVDLQAVTDKTYNLDTGFYPFVIDRNSAFCVAHGANPALVGLTLAEIFERVGLSFSDASALHQRFLQGGWVQYLWSDGDKVNSKLAYVVSNVTNRYYLGVGYENQQLPVDLPCSDDYDSWCSITNVRSLVGKAQFRLYQSESIGAFEATVFNLSFNPDYRIEGGFYTFMYNYDGSLKSHAILHDYLGMSLSDIFVKQGLGSVTEGADLHLKFVQAAEEQNSAWVQYQWRNSLDEETYTKIAFLVKIEFLFEQYYLGVGFNFGMDELPDGPLGGPCSANYNLPCSFRISYQLSSHTLSHAVSSPLPVNDMFDRISHDQDFKSDEFYVFVYDFNGTCVAHGASPSFVGLTLTEVFVQVDIPLNAEALHDQFRTAAQQGGGWVLYDWLTTDDMPFEKISYLFQMNLHGRSYYGGVGFNHQRAPVQLYSEIGLRHNGEPVMCSQDYDLKCSELNFQSILGEALADLTLASSEARRQTLSSETAVTLDDVMASITDRDPSYLVNDFHVAVFSVDGEDCMENDNSGCCLAHGSDMYLVGKTWQEILDLREITSIRGDNLHRQLVSRSNTGGSVLEYPWSKKTGAAQTKHAYASRFRNNSQYFYVVSEYLKTPQPPTCDNCPSNMECTRSDQAFCEKKPEPPITENEWFIFLIVLFAAGVPLAAAYFWLTKHRWRVKKKKLADEMKEMATRMEQQMQGMVEVVHDMPIQSPAEYQRKVSDKAAGSSQRNISGLWYWEEDSGRIKSHKKEMILDGTNFVAYSAEISDQIEHAYQLYREGRSFREFRVDLTNKITSTGTGGKVYSVNTGSHYEVDFEAMIQQNSTTKYQRSIHREKIEMQIASEVMGHLPRLPEDIDFSDDAENLLPTFKGQVIQVSKVHPGSQWLFGNVLYDPLLDDALKQQRGITSAGLNTILAQALHDRPTSGWFPRTVTITADVKVMTKLLNNLGGEGMDTLNPPPTWDEARDERIEVRKGSRESDEVANYFMAALYGQRDYVTVQKVERIQNLPLWQSYAVKKQTMKTRDSKDLSLRVNNKDRNLDAVERRWLFHGTQPEDIPKIEKQGFNRAFAGRNAVKYGKGVYFARDASYSSHEIYSVPDNRGVQYMFLCRVAVGDWCKGRNEQLTPDPKPHNNLELFDSTVDSVNNPSIFVIYHDAQAYPEYLVSFKREKKRYY